MRLLVIGGTRFFGREVVGEAIRRGHDVTLFHRGCGAQPLFPEAEHVHGDRFADLGRLTGRRWDAAFDAFAYVPRAVSEAARVLSAAVGRYWLVSSIAAYRPSDALRVDESAPLRDETDLADAGTEVVDFATSFGPLKGLCEKAALAGFPGRASVLRPSYIVGPGDHTDRLLYWVRRIERGGRVLAPGPRDAPAQWIDVRDLARFALDLLVDDASGTFNGVGPSQPTTFGSMLAATVAALGSGATLEWVAPEFLLDRGVVLGAELGAEVPLWHAPHDYTKIRCDPTRSLAAGLHCRSLADTVRDLAAWDRARGRPPLVSALGAERETKLLEEWDGTARH